MAGHSHWAGIKHHKEAADKKRAVVFSKLLKAISAAVKNEPNPDFNPRLRTAIDKAKEAQVPRDAIERATQRIGDAKNTEELVYEAYGPGGAAIMIFVATDNRNRAAQEIKKNLTENGGKWAESGSVRWVFAPSQNGEWTAKFPQELSTDYKSALRKLTDALSDGEDVQNVITNVK